MHDWREMQAKQFQANVRVVRSGAADTHRRHTMSVEGSTSGIVIKQLDSYAEYTAAIRDPDHLVLVDYFATWCVAALSNFDRDD